MIKAKVNGKPVEIETSYSELSFRKHIKIVERGIGTTNLQITKSDVLSVMLDIPAEVIKKADFEGLEPILEATKFLDDHPLIIEFPEKLGRFKIPQDITHKSVEQFETMEKYINKAAASEIVVDKIKPLAMYCAIYCQPLDGDPFDEEKAQWLSEQIMDYPCEEVMSAGTFFTYKFVSLRKGLSMNYLYKTSPLKRKRRVLDVFRRLSASMPRLITLRAIWDVLTRKR